MGNSVMETQVLQRERGYKNKDNSEIQVMATGNLK